MIGQKLKTAPPTDGHTNILTNFELCRDFIWAKILTKFHEDGTRNVASRTDVRWTKTAIRNVLTKFHEDCTKNMTSRVLKMNVVKTLDIIRMNALTKFHDD
ncbi:hypothetical protein DPMN_016013 [Dreissena polymorpha]|uniref:Uncharacterized protein n=1 Tax=Dreissena polymorpha TaxID=45954 RepID=A0A9D4N8W1_DREPO|nr:hypothetical protein DPMN_016013 [Dreissena polymorpha]